MNFSPFRGISPISAACLWAAMLEVSLWNRAARTAVGSSAPVGETAGYCANRAGDGASRNCGQSTTFDRSRRRARLWTPHLAIRAPSIFCSVQRPYSGTTGYRYQMGEVETGASRGLVITDFPRLPHDLRLKPNVILWWSLRTLRSLRSTGRGAVGSRRPPFPDLKRSSPPASLAVLLSSQFRARQRARNRRSRATSSQGAGVRRGRCWRGHIDLPQHTRSLKSSHQLPAPWADALRCRADRGSRQCDDTSAP